MKTAILALAMIFSCAAQAQDWDEDQTEVWKVVSQSWVDDVGETGKWPDAYVADNVVSWGEEWPVPRGKASISKWTRFRDGNTEVLQYELFPLAIVVEGNTGVVHYSVVSVRKNADGKQVRLVDGVIETLNKSKGVWKYISLGGFTIDDGS